jgi:hypothetical protein
LRKNGTMGPRAKGLAERAKGIERRAEGMEQRAMFVECGKKKRSQKTEALDCEFGISD